VTYAKKESATVSWYSRESCRLNPDVNCPTASGDSLIELERKGVLFCAKWDAKFGTRYKVCSRRSGACVNVVVLDRGPNKRLGRPLDLSKEAFRKIAPLDRGLEKVTIERLP
jgi:hypothetical protein